MKTRTATLLTDWSQKDIFEIISKNTHHHLVDLFRPFSLARSAS